MINKEQMLIILAIIKAAYPRFDDFRDSKRLAAANELWYRHFKEFDFNILQEAVHRYIDSGVYPPTVAEIRTEYKKLVDNFPNAAEAWNNLMINIRNYGLYRVDEGVHNLDEISKKVIEQLGGYRYLCLAENRELERLQERFFKVYSDEKDISLENVIFSNVPRLEGKIENVIQ